MNNWPFVSFCISWINSHFLSSALSCMILVLIDSKSNACRNCPGLSTNEIQIPYDKHHKVSSLEKKSPKHTQFCQIWSNMKMSNNSTKYEVLIKQYFNPGLKPTSILDVSRGGSRGRVQGVCTPPWDEAFFVFAFKICLPHRSVTSFLRGAPPPKKNPGSAPEQCQQIEGINMFFKRPRSQQTSCLWMRQNNNSCLIRTKKLSQF